MSETSDRDPAFSQSVAMASTNGFNKHLSPALVTDKNVESGSSDKFSSRFIGRMKQSLDVAVLCAVIVVVWVLLALPTIFYHLPESSPDREALSDICIPEIYTGSICREVLQAQQSCLSDRNATDDIIIAADPNSSQQVKEEQARLFIGGLPVLNPSPECMEAVVPFLCFYIFPLCDSSDRPYQPSSVQCREITDGICAQEFDTAESLAGEGQLPQCQLLPETTLDCNVTTLGMQENQGTMTSQTPTVQNSGTMCTPETYTGSVCREALQIQQSRILDRNATGDIIIAVDPASSQQDKEEQAGVLIGGLSFLNPSLECVEAAVPFLCFYIFPLCDSSGRPYQPSSAECSAVTDGICAQEFETAATFAPSNQLPQCQLLPDRTLERNTTDDTIIQLEDMMSEVDTILNTTTGRICSEGFYINDSTGLCVPECGEWEEFPHSFVVGVDAVVIISAIVYLLSGVAVLFLSCINYKRMFSFPSVFVVYSVIALGVLEIFLLIGYTDRTSLFCNSRDLSESVAKETPFCTVQGLVFYYAALVLDLFWIFHIMILFWRIVFPLHARHFETRGYFRYIHIVMVIAAIGLPWESLGTILGTGGLTIPRFPPVACFAKDPDASFYSFVLPISITNATGVSLITIILWVLITKVGALKAPSKNGGIEQTKLKTVNTAELKILIVFFYFFIFSVVSLTAFTIASRNVAEFISDLTVYFACESQGIQLGRMCERNFNRMESEIALCMVYILLGFFPIVSLVYVINYQEMKEKFSKFIGKSGDIPGTASASKASI